MSGHDGVAGVADPRPVIRAFLERFIGEPIRDADDIFAAGHVDSLFAIQLVLLIEREFSMRVESRDLELDNFRSVDAMATFVLGKLGRGA